MLVGILAYGLATSFTVPHRAASIGSTIVRSAGAVRMCTSDLSAFTVVQLKEKLRAAGLPVSGRKAELIARLGAGSGTSEIDAASVEYLSQSNDPLANPDFPPILIEACKS